MNIYKMKKEDLELLSFTDIAYEILKNDKKHKTTVELFKEIAKLLELSDEEYAETIGDFYTTLTTDKRFYALESGNWDLKERHSTKVVIDDDDDLDVEIDDVTADDEDNEDDEKDIDFDANEDYEDNDLEDLVIIDKDDSEEE